MDASKAPTPEGKAKECASDNKLDFDKIQACSSGAEGQTLLKTASLYFDKNFPQPVGVPHIEINGAALGNDRSYATILKKLCATGIKAGACQKDEMLIV